MDTRVPDVLNCPSNVTVMVELGTSETGVLWVEPKAIDASENVTRTSSHKPGQSFPLGLTTVSYYFQDSALNKALCEFTVLVKTGNYIDQLAIFLEHPF